MAHDPADAIFAPVHTINGWLDDHSRSLALPATLIDAIRYALLGPGKRIRPLLAWHACIACGGAPDLARPAAIALELVHAFSLVHDDLPALDNDDLRRGRPTLHRHTSEAMAILAGDAMLTLAFDAIARLAPAPIERSLARELTDATTAMIAGQIHDSLGGLPESLSPRERLERIHHDKTGALIRAAARMGAHSAGLGADDPRLDTITTYADALGLMFQITDDLLDVEGTAAQTGKRTNKDAQAGKLTYPGVMGVEASKAEVARLLDVCRTSARALGQQAPALAKLADFVAARQT